MAVWASQLATGAGLTRRRRAQSGLPFPSLFPMPCLVHDIVHRYHG